MISAVFFSFFTFEGIYNRFPRRRRFSKMRIRELDVPTSENRIKHVALAALQRALSTSTHSSLSLVSLLFFPYCLCEQHL